MTDPASMIAAGLAAGSSAIKLVQTFSDVRDEAKVLALKTELLGLLVQAQTAQLALVHEKDDLEAKLRAFEAWDREKDRYRLEKLGSNNSFVYGLKDSSDTPEGHAKLCANCFEHRKKSYLQPHTITVGRAEVLCCEDCGAQILMKGVAETRRGPAPTPTRSAGTWGRR
jgi:hypothetical protein